MTAERPTILATCGGLDGGTWTDSVYGPLLLHAIELARVKGRRPRVAHLNTAGGDQRHVEGAELEAARAADVDASHIRFFPHPNIPDLRAHLLAQDVVWVSGGSVVNLLAVWRAHGLDALLREAWQAGVVLAGGSAGALCWHEGGTTSSYGPAVSAVRDGLGFVPGSLAVHWDSQPARRPAHLAAVSTGGLPGGYALEEGTGLVYQDARVVDIVTERPGAAVWRVERSGAEAVESRLEPRLLPGASGSAPGTSGVGPAGSGLPTPPLPSAPLDQEAPAAR
ncbi:Type 1 glutamine amidotransferase-like domain-containing protein [Leifsonia sp. F6_8S_P_1B]|uniref:Type 1 glutamine amidotransferase-like domain-containing protein n=1 Tax=Leifsonia williamsii TaxID=3035919 RepID=A0ABT8K936_9MICO|nr:Type 1 glutamine amidotransferase-like domain-containing protein [Leifsonia williamsii]MDN4612992.1 Type 1 glutamine amidotransferase-like domain-containing protein [Leifsonia williamsii]